MSPGLAVLFGSSTGQCAHKIDSAFFSQGGGGLNCLTESVL